MNNRVSIVLILVAVSVFLPNATRSAYAQEPTTFFVGATGDDSNPGTQDKPFATLLKARDAVREARKTHPGQPCAVNLLEGVYYVDKTLELTAEDSGTAAAPVVYRAAPGAVVRLVGGRAVTGFGPVQDEAVLGRLDEATRGKVVQADLGKLGITDFGQLKARGFGRGGGPAELELFFKKPGGDYHEAMTLARWPNEDWSTIAKEPNQKLDDRFHYTGDRPERWTKAEDLWVHGYWTQDWADTYEKVAKIDTENKVIHTLPPHGAYGYTPGKRFYALNLLEELDSPGEWYLNRDTGILYFWPPADMADSSAIVSTLNTFFALNGASHVLIEGLTLECCRAEAISIKGGTGDLVAGCTIRNTGNRGVNISSGGTRNGVRSCDLYDTGEGGIGLSGGDRKTLTKAELFAANNHIWRYSRRCRTYRPAIGVSGVGNTVSHNLIHDGPHNAIQLGGNDNIIEFNELHHVCQETGDVGAYYMGRNWTMRGNIIRHNFFHDIHGPYTHGAMAVYLDDAASGTTIFGNVFYRASRAAFIGGGRDNVVENNIFVECKPAVHIDSRGIGWAKKYAVQGGGWQMYKKLEEVKHTEPPYSERYPKLAGILEDDPILPKGNVIVRNVMFGGDHFHLSDEGKQFGTIEDNFTEGDPGFVDAENLNFQLKDDSPVYTQIPGFKRIPFEQIGLMQDEYRKTK